MDNKQVAVIGGGPSGLTLARLLQLKGVTAKVYERDIDKDARVQGSPLDMHEESGMAALRKAGLTDAFEKNVRTGADKKIITDKSADILFSDHAMDSEESLTGKSSRPEIDRGVLRKILLESLQPGTVVWNSHFVSMERKNEGWQLHFKNTMPVYADLVVAADGANSKIRPYITPIKAFYVGITMLELNIHDAVKTTPHMNTLLNGGKIMAFGDSKCMLGGQKGEGDLGFYASFKTDESWAMHSHPGFSDNWQMLSWFQKEYADWNPVWYELFEKSVTPFIPRPLYCMPLNQTWEALPHATLMGDAAHVMPPFAGEGANTAMLDALELSERITSDSYHTLHEAIADYETNMRKRAAKAAQESLENGERMHSESALQIMPGIFGRH